MTQRTGGGRIVGLKGEVERVPTLLNIGNEVRNVYKYTPQVRRGVKSGSGTRKSGISGKNPILVEYSV